MRGAKPLRPCTCADEARDARKAAEADLVHVEAATEEAARLHEEAADEAGESESERRDAASAPRLAPIKHGRPVGRRLNENY